MFCDGKRDIVLWGCGLEGERFYYRFFHLKAKGIVEANVCCVVDNGHVNKKFHGFVIQSPNDIRGTNNLICVSTSEHVYRMIRAELIQQGKEEFRDFIWARMYFRKLCVWNGNCHFDVYLSYLNLSEKFRNQFCVYPFEAIMSGKPLPLRALEEADLFLYQHVKGNDPVFACRNDEHVFPFLKDDTIKISVPNFYPLGEMIYQSQIRGEFFRYELINGVHIILHDRLIDKAYSCGEMLSVEELIKTICTIKLDFDSIKADFDKAIQELKRRQTTWDIYVLDFFLENYRDIPMFYDFAHPSKELMIYVCRKLAKLLILDDIDDNFFTSDLNGTESFVWPQIREALQLNYNCKTVNGRSSIYDKNRLDLKEYLREYIWLFYGKLLP